MINKLLKLRQLLVKYGVEAYLQPVHDEWMSEYPPACNRRVEWLTGFSGSAGLVIVTANKAAMLVDGRYSLQARAQVSAQYEVHNSADVSAQKWLADNLPTGAKIGCDPKLYTRKALEKFGSLQVVSSINLIDELWEDRPAAPATPIFAHEQKYSGETVQNKRLQIAAAIEKAGAECTFLSAPESVNWLLNIRAGDVENTPLCLANAIIDASGKVWLFIHDVRISANLKEHLGAAVEICHPENMKQILQEFSGKKMLVDVDSATSFLADLCEESGILLQFAGDPCTLPKALKNEVEIAGIRCAHIRDGVAVAKFLCWLSDQENVSELEVTDKLLYFRTQNNLFVEPSFDTIAGSGEHGAIVHYRADEKSNRILQKGELFLLDSGGQYYDGTTDITRTVAIGTPAAEHKIRFTQVLKGHIALANAKFPEGTAGSQLDVLARQYLWQAGLDYDHGTGHGVGCFLGVHEGPQRISKRGGDAPLMSGMVLSNEPGYYKQGEYGIRIESLVTVVEKLTAENGKKFFGFDTLTCVPIDLSLVDVSLLLCAEKQWLNNYHKWVEAILQPFLNAREQEWLAKSCSQI